MKAQRGLDIVVAACGLIVTSPLLLLILLAVFLQDRHSPIYSATRVGLNGRNFTMHKVRSMIKGADRTGVESTGVNDARITALGGFIRRWKIDEIPQLWNVLLGEMSLVGPRPNTPAEVNLYNAHERRLLKAVPGITDIASIVFADEGDILRDAADPDGAYRSLIWPWKRELGLIYVDHSSVGLNMRLIILTVWGIVDRTKAVQAVGRLLQRLGASESVRTVASRTHPLEPVSAESE